MYSKHIVAVALPDLTVLRLEILQCFTECVTVNGRPFNWLLDSGFQRAIKRDMVYLETSGVGICLTDNFAEVKEYINRVASDVREKIKSEVAGKMVSVLTDITTKNRRAILGVSMKYMHNDTLRKRAVGMIQLNQSHTGEHLKNVITSVLADFGVSTAQILSATVDNGSNIVKMVNLWNEATNGASSDTVNEAADNELDENAGDEFPNQEAVSNDELANILDEIELEARLSAELNEDEIYRHMIIDLGYVLEGPDGNEQIRCIRCGAHTIQLIVWTGIRTSIGSKWISLARKIAKHM